MILRGGFINLILVGCLVVMLVGCCENYEWHQMLTVEVATPTGTKIGSAVVAVSWSGHDSFSNNYHSGYRGEATIVDLDDGRYLFALIGERTKYLGLKTFNGNAGISEEIFAAMMQTRVTRPVAPKNYPLLVTFDDVTDPTSIKKVDPGDLAATFGPGYSLKSVMLEVTDTPVTEGRVEDVLGWLGDHKVMRNPGWNKLPIEARSLIGNLMTRFPDYGGN